MDITKINDKDTLYTFYGIGDYVDFAESNTYWNRGSSSHSTSRDSTSFAGGSYNEALKQAAKGNPELVKEFYDKVDVINAMIDGEGDAYSRDVTGEFFDTGDFLSGEPECWWKNDSVYGARKVVPVYANISMCAGVSNSVIRNRGCAIVALCDMLQRQRFIVDLNIVMGKEASWMGGNGRRLFQRVIVHTDPIDLDMVAFIIGNPLFYRRLQFSVTEIYAERSHPAGYGTPCEYQLEDIFDSGLSGFYFTSSNHSTFSSDKYRTPERAKDHVLSMIEEFKQNEKQVIFG